MARRRKTGRGPETEPTAGTNTGKAKPLPQATTSLGPLLKAAGLAKASAPSLRTLARPGPQSLVPVVAPKPAIPAAPATSPATELRMLNDAYAGARPLPRKVVRTAPARPIVPQALVEADRADEAAARAPGRARGGRRALQGRA